MFGYTGDDLTVFAFFFALGIPLLWDAMKEREWGWRRYAAIVGGTAFILAGLFWEAIKKAAPEFAAKTSLVATSFQTWAFLLLVAIAAFLLSGPLVRRSRHTSPDAAVPLSNEALGLMDQYLEARLKGINGSLESVWKVLNDFKAVVESIDTKTAVPPNLGDTVMEAFRTVEQSLQSQIARMRDEVKAFDNKILTCNGLVANADNDIRNLLDFTTTDATRSLINNILKFVPSIPIPESMTHDDSQRLTEFVAAVQSTLSGTMYQSAVRNILQAADGDADQSFRHLPAESFPSDITPGEMRSRMITIRRVELLATWLANQREALDGEMAAKQIDLAVLLQRRRNSSVV